MSKLSGMFDLPDIQSTEKKKNYQEYDFEQKQEAVLLLQEGKLFRSFKDIADKAEIASPLFGSLYYRSAITGEVGEPGLGKTTLKYSMVTTTQKGKAFLGMYAQEPLKVLYCDFESGDALVKMRYDKIGHGEDYPDFQIMNLDGISFPQLLPAIDKYFAEFPFNLLVIDNRLTAFDTFDENDNAEAKKQVSLVRQVAKRFNCAVSFLHHPSKSNQVGTRKGSGAYAWARHCDIQINYNPVPDTDVYEIEIAKNRWVEDKVPIYFRKVGDGQFEKCPPPLCVTFKASEEGILGEIALELQGTFTRQEILKYVQKRTPNVAIATFDRMLMRLTNEGRIKKNRYNSYFVNFIKPNDVDKVPQTD